MNRYNNLRPFRDEGRLRVLRQWLNIFFILGAIAGMLCFKLVDTNLGIYILIAASVLKFIELTLRMMKL
jgi:hypothetical protein